MIKGKDNQHKKREKVESKPTIKASDIVEKACSVYIEKGRFHSTASKLSKTKLKCMRIGREL